MIFAMLYRLYRDIGNITAVDFIDVYRKRDFIIVQDPVALMGLPLFRMFTVTSGWDEFLVN